MPRPPSPSIPEKEFLFASLQQGLRLDGRLPLEMRTPTISFGQDLGWVEVSLGKTKVLAQVDGKMVKPTPERPLEGMITISSEISPMASSDYEPGRPSDEEVTMTRMLDKVLRRSDAVDKESLCVLAGQRVWHLRINIHCLSDAGNLLDCACLAGIIALRHYRRPEVEVAGEEVIIHDPSERAPVPLSIHHTPYTLTFAYFPSPSSIPNSPSHHEPIVILDPNLLEQRLAAGTLTLSLNATKELCVVQKAGGVPLGVDEVIKVVDIAVQRVVELDRVVGEALKEDWSSRKVEVR